MATFDHAGPPLSQSATSRRRYRLHPAWVMLAMGTAGCFLSAPGQSFSVAVFIDPMLSDLGVDRTGYSGAYLWAGICGGMVLPFIGRLLDRWGARVMLPLLGLLLGIACVVMSRVDSVAQLYVGFTLIRCIGQGGLGLSSTWLVGEWFERRRGLAMGIVGLGGAASVMVIPLLNDTVIGHFGWRSAWLVLAGMVWLGLVLPTLWLVRDRPEPLGLLPDARWVAPQLTAETALEQVPADPHTGVSLNLAKALAEGSFWRLLGVWCTTAMVGTGLLFHQVSLLGTRDVPRQWALLLLGMQAGVATLMAVFAGILTDRGKERQLLAVSMLFLASAILLLLFLPGREWAVLYGVLLGLLGGIIRTAGNAVWINYYGRAHQGSIRGVAMAAAVAAAAMGPLPLAVCWDQTGQYTAALWCYAALPLLAGACVWGARRPVKLAGG
ncbi:MAG: MFS transporter [Planctomycetota bacterium]|nr:MFS transporter [Planctomycetota bacterium]